MHKEGTWESKPRILRNGRAYGKGFLRRGTSISRLQGNMEQAARPEPGAPCVYIDRKLHILYESAAGSLSLATPHQADPYAVAQSGGLRSAGHHSAVPPGPALRVKLLLLSSEP